MSERFESYGPALEALVAEAIQCTPAGWSSGRITVECDGSYMGYALMNDSSEDKASITPKFRSLCEELYATMARSGDRWLAAAIEFSQTGEGKWSMDAKFTYPEVEKKPWWKLWQ